MPEASTQLRVVEETPAYWRVVFDNPPLNIMGATMFRGLQDLLARMEASASLRDAFFGTGLDASLSASASGFFGASGSAQRAIVINGLANAIGTTAAPQMASAVQAEVDALITRVPQINPAATVTQATVAACTAALASGAVTLQ